MFVNEGRARRCLTILLVLLLFGSMLGVVPPAAGSDELPSPPPAIQIMAVPHNGSILITWSPVPQDDVYGVYRLDLTRIVSEDFSNLTVIAQLSPDATSYMDEDVVPGVTYHYWLFIMTNLDEPGYEYWTSTVIGVRADAVVPNPPMGLAVTAGSGEANLTWNEPIDDGGGTILNYTVLIGLNETDLRPVMSVPNYEHYWKRGCTVRNLTNGQVYYFAVRAVNPIGPSNMTDVVSVKPLPSPHLTVEYREESWGHFNISVSWSPPASGHGEVVKYVLYIYGISMYPTVLEFEPGERNFSHEWSPFGELITYRVAAVYQDGNVFYSNAEEIQFAMYEGVGFDVSGLFFVIAVVAVMIAGALIGWVVHRRR